MKILVSLTFALVQVLITNIAVADNSNSRSGRIFQKRIENNYANNVIVELPNGKTDGMYNCDSKSAIEKLFFRDFNAPVEYFYDPSAEVSPIGPQGLRIYRDSIGRWIAEVMHIVNFREVNSALEQEFPIRSVLWNEKLSEDEEKKIRQQNREMKMLQTEQQTKRYQIISQTVPLSDTLTIALYERTMQAIDKYVSPGKPVGIFDGYSVVFRTIVGNELWTFKIDSPTGEFLVLSNLFCTMIADLETGKFDEGKYFEMLR